MILQDIIIYLFQHYPYPNELSKARVVKMIYLADWKSAIDQQKQITDIVWRYNHYGPYVEEVIESIRIDSRFEVRLVTNIYGKPKEIIGLRPGLDYVPKLENWIVDVLNFVIQKTSVLRWDEFISLIYSTYPIIKYPKYSTLNLVESAKEYQKILKDKLKPTVS